MPEGVNDESMQDMCSLMAEGNRTAVFTKIFLAFFVLYFVLLLLLFFYGFCVCFQIIEITACLVIAQVFDDFIS